MNDKPIRMRFNTHTNRYEAPRQAMSPRDFWIQHYSQDNNPLAAYDYVIESLLDDVYLENGCYPHAEAIIHRIRKNLDENT